MRQAQAQAEAPGPVAVRVAVRVAGLGPANVTEPVLNVFIYIGLRSNLCTKYLQPPQYLKSLQTAPKPATKLLLTCDRSRHVAYNSNNSNKLHATQRWLPQKV